MDLTMQIKVLLAALGILAATGPAFGSFWDSVPVASQIKTLAQAASGDTQAAGQTEENFLNQAPIISQVKSMVELAEGDKEAAKKTQEQFFHGFVEPIVDNSPVIGHIKGGITMATGDKEKGRRIIEGASASTAEIIGGIFGGPGGAIAAGAATDGIITGIDSAVNRNYTPFGVVDYVSNIKKHSVGENVDAIFGIGAEFAGGKMAERGGEMSGYKKLGGEMSGYKKLGGEMSGYKKLGGEMSGYKKLGGEMSGYKKLGGDLSDYNKLGGEISGYNKLGGDMSGHKKLGGGMSGEKKPGSQMPEIEILGGKKPGDKKSGGKTSGDKMLGRLDAWTMLARNNDGKIAGGKKPRSEVPDGKKPGFGASPPKWMRNIPDLTDVDMESPPVNRPRHRPNILEQSQRDLSKPWRLKIACKTTGLSEYYAKRLEPIDFREVNDAGGNMNCYYCSLAALKGETALGLLEEIEVMVESEGAPNIQYIVDLYKNAGFVKAKCVFEGSPQQLRQFLQNNLMKDGMEKFSLAFRRNDGTGHVVNAKAWKSREGFDHLLLTDFQKPFSAKRFTTELPDNLKTVSVISYQ